MLVSRTMDVAIGFLVSGNNGGKLVAGDDGNCFALQ